MKVGRIILVTTITLAWSTLATAGPVDPCAPSTDLDLDTICDDVDNCPPSLPSYPLGVSNPAQTDTDGDGRGDACDNCITRANGPLSYDLTFGGTVSQCDRDSDGYGNACDSDVNQDAFQSPLDSPLFSTLLTCCFFPPVPKIADMNCDGFMTPLDSPLYSAQLASGLFRGPSGWVATCPLFGPTIPGCGPPLP